MKRTLLAVMPLLAASSVLAQTPLDYTTTPVANVTADAIASLPNGTVASINGSANTVSLITTPALTVSTFTVPTPNSGLAGITGGPDGNFWFTESIARQIGRLTADGTITEFPIPAGAPPPQRIAPGPQGTLWANACPFIDAPYLGCGSFIVMSVLGPSEPNATLLPIGTPPSTSFGPSRCTLGADDNEWCVGNENTQNPYSSQFKIAVIDRTGGYAAYMPATGTQSSAILKGPDGNVYYSWLSPGDSTGLGRITPSGMITEYPIMTGNRNSWMFGLGVGVDGNLYSADRQTGILYQFVLPTATDAGTATINSGPIAIDIPEDLAPGGGPGSGCPPGGAFIVRSGGSLFGGLVYVQTKAPTECTDLVADVEIDRYSETSETSGTAICHDDFFSQNDAKSAVLSISLPPGSLVSTKVVLSGLLGADGTCTATGSEVRCDAPIIKKGYYFEVEFSGAIQAGDIDVRCTSVTPETDPDDNEDHARNVEAVLPGSRPTIDLQVPRYLF